MKLIGSFVIAVAGLFGAGALVYRFTREQEQRKSDWNRAKNLFGTSVANVRKYLKDLFGPAAQPQVM